MTAWFCPLLSILLVFGQWELGYLIYIYIITLDPNDEVWDSLQDFGVLFHIYMTNHLWSHHLYSY
jgi:hypothetical protein